MLTRSISVLFAISLVAVACSQSTPGGVPAGPGGDRIILTGDQKADWEQIVALENQAKALVKADGCSTTDECRTAPVGSEDAMFKQIVVGTDGSSGANIAVDAAIELARLTGATLHVVSARKTVSPYALAGAPEAGMAALNVDESNAAVLAEGQRLCDQVVERAAKAGVHGEAHCVDGDAADALTRVAEDSKADLLVVGNRGMSGARRFVLGSVPNKLSHNSPSSLLIVDTSTAR